MWIKPEDLKLAQPDSVFLEMHKEHHGEEYTTPKLEVIRGITVLSVNPHWLEPHYTNLTHLICHKVYLSDEDVIVNKKDTLENMCRLMQEGYEIFTTYGSTDMYSTKEECVSNLLKHYPELQSLGDCKGYKFAITLDKCRADYRFHKNGRYRGNDEVGEHVYDSPAEEYLGFCVVMLEE